MVGPIMKPGIRDYNHYTYNDREIIDLLVFLHARGFRTTTSCQGHQIGHRRKETEHLIKVCEEGSIPYDRDEIEKDKASFFYIDFHFPSGELEKADELRGMYNTLVSRLKEVVSPDNLKGLKFEEHMSTRGNLNVHLHVNNAPWPEEDYDIMRRTFTEIAKEGVEDPYVGDKVDKILRKTEEKLRKLGTLARFITGEDL